MKKLILALTVALSFSVFAEEIPVPAKVVMFDYPTLNGLPFAAVFAHDYETLETVGGVNIQSMASNSARLICLFLGYDRVYTYSLFHVPEKRMNVLFMDENLIANPVETRWIDGKFEGEFRTTAFSKLGCFKSRPY